ncbi:MAG: hypothetical protein HY921_08430 [Elusimicrobia bacterium]|nr:hypothetical protein [Elusimicrobiota bacterium]
MRKHGSKARLAMREERDIHCSSWPADRVKRKLTYESQTESYLWITDRGRSRLIKH